MDKIEAKELLNKYAQGKCTEEELAILHTWYLANKTENTGISIEEVETAKQQIWSNLPVHEIGYQKTVKLFSLGVFKKLAVAAAVVISVSVGYYFIQRNNITSNNQLTLQNEIVPGGNKATLTLANGTKIHLNKTNNGVLSKDNGTRIVKTQDGQILYTSAEKPAKEVAWNLLSIPVGGYYNVTLSDGTVVWLNSKSSLKYPTEFTEKERVVELTGEGYFVVAHLNNRPFKVKTEHQIVEVLGTHFNINAYDDEQSITTTLLEGSVKINANGSQKILTPNQHAKLNNGKINISQCNADNAIDWVNNDFIFDDENLGSIMRKVSRWYNVEVSIPEHLVDLKFTGSISRSKNITQVLKIMELTGMVNFNVKGRRITAMK